MPAQREPRVIETFVALSDTLVEGFGVDQLLRRLVEQSLDLLDAAAVTVAVQHGPDAAPLVVVSSSGGPSDEASSVTTLATLPGPGAAAAESGLVVTIDDTTTDARWPDFTAEATRLGHRSATAVPLRLRDERLGALTVLAADPRPLPANDVVLLRALADVAAIGILRERAVRTAEQTRDQLQTALTSRIVIEQAKGVLAERRGISVDEAFDLLRTDARARSVKLATVARDVVEALPPRP